jgi:hypothetical protein
MFKPFGLTNSVKENRTVNKKYSKSMSYTEQQKITYEHFNTNHFEKNR